MRLRKKESKVSKSQLLLIGSLSLILVGSVIIGTRFYQSYYSNKIEQEQIDEFIDIQRDIVPEEQTIEVNADKKDEEEKNTTKVDDEEYIAVIDIPEINLRKGIYAKESSKNNVDKNIEILKESDMPDKVNGNFMLAGHSGNSRISYFKNLDKLEKDDIAYIYYNGGRYVYKLVNSYEIEKTGMASISRNGQKTTLTLITCKHNSNKQIIFIFELMKDGE